MQNDYRGRFAPSPTGQLHLGTARTALLAWLRARQAGGAIVLRIEDLDTPRVVAGSQQGILDDLDWLGLHFDEGPAQGGAFGPYVQSQCLPRYQAALERLKASGHAYPCTCSRKEIEAVASAPHGEDGVLYPGTCRVHTSHPERTPSWRFRMDKAQAYTDRLAGPQAGLADDFVIQRADGVFAYQLACAVDDAAMAITEVVRGDDLAGSASRQIALLKALALPVPDYFHAPLLLGEDGQRLAKRHGAVSIASFREDGWPSEAVVGLLAATLNLVKGGVSASASSLVGSLDLAKFPRHPVKIRSAA